MKAKTCFLIDDDEDDKEIFAQALQQIDDGIRCVTASDGIEALQKLEHDQRFVPDYIFLDLNMPLMGGKECLKAIRQQSRLDHVPVVIYSTSSDPKDIEETKKLGANSFMIKPPRASALFKTLTDFFADY